MILARKPIAQTAARPSCCPPSLLLSRTRKRSAERRQDPNKKLTNAASTFSCLSFLCVFVPYVGLLIAAPLWIAGFVLCIMLLVKGEYSRGAGTMIFLFLFVPFAWALRLGYALGL
jgi:hypothetical protein